MRLQVGMGCITTHGGVIISGSSDTVVEGVPLARLFDLHACPFHGINCIVQASSDVFTNNLGNARAGDLCACGATCAPPPNCMRTFTN